MKNRNYIIFIIMEKKLTIFEYKVFQSNIFKLITNAPPCISNHTLHSDIAFLKSQKQPDCTTLNSIIDSKITPTLILKI